MILNNFQKSFDSRKVLRLLGARRGRRVSPASLRRIDLLTESIKTLLQPQLSYRVLGLSETTRDGLRLSNGAFFKSPKLAETMAEAETVCCFIATVGPVVDMEIQHLMKENRYADAYVLDALGSMSAESVVEQFYQRMAKRQAETNGGVTLRFSPGYCDWPIGQQRRLFDLFNKKDLPNVSLNDSCLMTPRKSVSGLFGLLPPGVTGARPGYNPCRHCAKGDCLARRSN